ncbi:signal peptide peptidase-like 2A isoform X5 [Oncorhynchus mykiss]|uniref:signal peptide peptidase-like 2A isoform X5 n=1 Tax=Oncorhynchus mykiss TaxID=8022 RepID=UPI001878271D|nr:signal peptide peptidase-like 2A isoform X5 [Oncorhynchus mykiss]XP_036836948.1 signal peptide peptidase-like 2A isoform X5 [Oncorhynchus mykiss]
MAKTPWIIILSVILRSSQVICQEAILHISNGATDKEYCLVYNSLWTNLSLSLSAATAYPLVNLSSRLLCSSAGVSPAIVRGKAVVVMRGGCNFSQKAEIAQDLGAAALIVASTKPMSPPGANVTEYEKVQIPLALMRYMDFLDAQNVFGEEMQVRLYAPAVPVFDASIVVMLLIGVVTVALGGYWSGACERERLRASRGGGGRGGEEKSDSGDLALYSPLKVVIFVGLMCLMLVLMYFFYKYLVYVIIAIFCLASATALFSCLDALLDLAKCSPMSVTVLGGSVSVRSVLLSAVCVTVAVVWGVYRNEDRWIWILQDLLGVAFCLNFLKTISLSNFKICVILLSLLLLYDVFFVFITPLFMPNGESIMVQVALGPDAAGEKLPVVMRVPRFSAWTQNLCGMQFSILGYGDIIVPGLLVAYCSRFDVWVNSPKKIYLFCCCIAYLCGMVLTFAVMLVTKMGQPALLYLVPFTLLGSALLAWRRGEMRQFWNGTTYEMEHLTLAAEEESADCS